MDIFFYCLLSAFGALLVFMVLRTVFTKPKNVNQLKILADDLRIDKNIVAAHLSDAVKIPTVSLQKHIGSGDSFIEYHKFIEDTYPLIAENSEKTIINRYSVIYKLKGSDDSLLPVAVLSHQDVVPAPSEGWIHPPFAGVIDDGYVYGRGAVDMKAQMIAALEAMELLLKDGFRPKRSVYFCFGHDEELRGTEGAGRIGEYLFSKGVKLDYVIDEGGIILDGSLLGINNKIALIGICEKGYADFRLEAAKAGGHAATPAKRSAVGLLSEAVNDVELNQRRPYWSKPAKEMIKALAPYMKPLFKFIFVNRDILSPILKVVLTRINPMTNSLLRTTLAPTQLKGSKAPNVMPPKATANINCRINIGETTDIMQKHIESIVGKKISVILEEGGDNPSPVSDIACKPYENLTNVIREVFGGYVTAPFPFIAATDSKYYYKLTNNVYRFSPFEYSEDDSGRIHAINERQSIDGLASGVRFFIRLYETTVG